MLRETDRSRQGQKCFPGPTIFRSLTCGRVRVNDWFTTQQAFNRGILRILSVVCLVGLLYRSVYPRVLSKRFVSVGGRVNYSSNKEVVPGMQLWVQFRLTRTIKQSTDTSEFGSQRRCILFSQCGLRSQVGIQTDIKRCKDSRKLLRKFKTWNPTRLRGKFEFSTGVACTVPNYSAPTYGWFPTATFARSPARWRACRMLHSSRNVFVFAVTSKFQLRTFHNTHKNDRFSTWNHTHWRMQFCMCAEQSSSIL